jgi:energy-coupling factor transport system permease protein
MALRIVLLIIISSSLTYTTTPNDLTDGIEHILSPLKFIGLKNAVHTLALMMTIALRFIPTLVEEAEKIMNAQKARGADLESGTIIERIKALIPILIPLLISSVRRAYELAEAMECRCYNGGEGKTRMKQLKMTAVDFKIIVITLIYGLAVILMNIIL